MRILNLTLREQSFSKVLYFLLSISTLLSLIYLIYYLIHENNFTFYEIDEINVKLIGEKIETCGIVEYINPTSKVLFIKLTNYVSSIEVVDFDFKYSNFSKGDFVCVKGVVKRYKGRLEIVVQ